MADKRLGHYAFVAGVLLALVVGLFANQISMSAQTNIVYALLVLGLVVGVLNITAKEATEFLVAAIVLLAAGSINLSMVPVLGQYIQSVLAYIGIFVAPAAVIVALKAVRDMAERK